MWRKVSPWAPGVQRHVRSFMFLDQQLMLKGFSGGTGKAGMGAEVWAGHGQGEGGLVGCQPGGPPLEQKEDGQSGRGQYRLPSSLEDGVWEPPGSQAHPGGPCPSACASIPTVQPKTRGPMIHTPLQREMLPPRSAPGLSTYGQHRGRSRPGCCRRGHGTQGCPWTAAWIH